MSIYVDHAALKHKLKKQKDVKIVSPADGEVLTYVAADKKWENKAPSGGAAHNVAYAESTTLQTIVPEAQDYLGEMDLTVAGHAGKRLIVDAQASFGRDSGTPNDVVLVLTRQVGAGIESTVTAVAIYIAQIRGAANRGRYAGFIFYTFMPDVNADIRFRLAAFNGCDANVVSQGNHIYFRRKLLVMELVS